ncbi:hypothetical protein C8A03DRAFT_45089 [Achaetomium macrosporum]|uniref:Uncharacterized protein n=1 Tax=Achaetomium macrosporum TaxID=79813 RepID=A0AAN7C7V3_9PEZI|nr:hypothetical protein C8A03DRAFT_45089 [Achaetomium macrosporum]
MKVHKPQCSLPGQIDGYVSSPDIRGTLDIVWTCVSTLLLCAWTDLHLNIPIEPQGAHGRAQNLHRQIYLAIRKLQWMGITLAAPELAQEYAHADGVEWTLTHSFLANMGGFAVEFEDDETLAEPTKHTTYWYNIRALRGSVWILDARQLLAARERAIIAALPRTSSDDIDDRSKSDALVKVLTAGQVLWLIIQLILRAARGLAVTQLEIVTLAFALCSLATASRAASADDMKVLARLGPTTFWYLRATTWVPNNSVHYLDAENIRWLLCLAGYSPLQIGIMTTLVLSVPFGAVHLLSWNAEFPTQGERLGWNIACLLTTAVPFPLMATMMYGAEAQRKLFRLSLASTKTIVAWQIGLLMAMQALGRLFVLVEAFRSLSSQPDTAFITTDTASVPHLG